MTTANILYRLRCWEAKCYEYGADGGALLRDAANEIESLRAKLADAEEALTIAYMSGQHAGRKQVEAKLASMEPVVCSTAVEVKLPEKLPLTEKVTGYPLSPGRSNFVEGYNYALDEISSLGKLYTISQPAPVSVEPKGYVNRFTGRLAYHDDIHRTMLPMRYDALYTPQPAPDVQAAVAAALEKAVEVCRHELTELRNMPIPCNGVERAIRAIPRDTSVLDEYKADIKRLVDTMQTIADGGARITPQKDKCSHGQYGFELCESCIEDYARTHIAELKAKYTV